MISDPESSDLAAEANRGFERIWTRAHFGLKVLIGAVTCAGRVGGVRGWPALAGDTRLSSAPVWIDDQRLMRANAPAAMVVNVSGRLPEHARTRGVGSERLDRAAIGRVEPAAAMISTTARGARSIGRR